MDVFNPGGKSSSNATSIVPPQDVFTSASTGQMNFFIPAPLNDPNAPLDFLTPAPVNISDSSQVSTVISEIMQISNMYYTLNRLKVVVVLKLSISLTKLRQSKCKFFHGMRIT